MPDIAPIPATEAPLPIARSIDPARRGPARRVVSLLVASLLCSTATMARADWIAQGDQLRVTYGPWAYHFSHSDEHARFNHLFAVELVTQRWRFLGADRASAGLALFDNSFGQFSQYLSFGQEWDLLRVGPGDLFVNVSVGLLHGYKEPYQDKIPFNRYGVAPAAIPTLGWRYGPFALTMSALGTNGFLFGASWAFDLRP